MLHRNLSAPTQRLQYFLCNEIVIKPQFQSYEKQKTIYELVQDNKLLRNIASGILLLLGSETRSEHRYGLLLFQSQE